MTKTPDEVQMNSEVLDHFREYANEELYGLNSLLIVRSGYLIFEEYFKGWNAEYPHQLYSTTKSVTSALVGIAIDQGLFNVNDSVLGFFPDYSFANLDSRKQNMTVEHLLNMKSGLDWDEWSYDYFNSNNHYNQMLNSLDWVQYILDRPMATNPGIV
jgi:CubicO group peptidase (beta-lactamase class C family)